jgi:UDP-2,4-diacetamido-2,4,6-trideoxy-beta-L-altropyranose hydrolase
MSFDSSARLLWLRCDADRIMGFGHFYRQMALAQHAHDLGWYVTMCVHQSMPESLQKLARAEGIELLCSHRSRASIEEAEWFCEQAREAEPDAMVIDGYHLSEAYIAVLKADVAIVFFEDDGTRSAPADLVVNLSPGSEALDYSKLPGTPEFALGPGFALLRRQFITHRPARAVRHAEVERVLVTLGGGDMSDEVECALRGLDLTGYTHHCDVMLGSMDAERLAQLDDMCKHELGFSVEIHQGVQEVAALMAPQHMAICAAGGTSWELASLGVPMLQAELFDNQRLIATHLHEHGVTSFLGGRAHFTPEHIAGRASALMRDDTARLEMTRRGRELVDGRGARRLLERIALL